MWHFRTWFSGGHVLTVWFNDRKSLLHPKQFCDSTVRTGEMALTAILTKKKREKNLTWIIWSLTTGLRSYNFCNVHIRYCSRTGFLFFRQLLHLKIWTKLHSHKNHQNPNPEFGLPCLPPPPQRDKFYRLQRTKIMSSTKIQECSKNKVQLQHHAMDNVFQFRLPGFWVRIQELKTHPIMMKTSREIFWMTIFWSMLDDIKEDSHY